MKKHERDAVKRYLDRICSEPLPEVYLVVANIVDEKLHSHKKKSLQAFNDSVLSACKKEISFAANGVLCGIDEEVKKAAAKQADPYTSRVVELEEYLADLLEEHDSGHAYPLDAAKQLVDRYWPELKKKRRKK